MPTGAVDPTERVTAPVGAPAPEAEATEEFLSPEEVAEKARAEEFEGEPGKGAEHKKAPDVMTVPVKGRLNTAMRLANSVNSYLNSVTELAKDIATKFFGGPEMLGWVLRPTTKDRQILSALLKEVNLPPQQFQELVDIAKDLELDAASLENLKESLAGPNNVLIQFAEVVEEENKRVVTVLREMLVLKPDKAAVEEYVKWADDLIGVQERVLGEARKGAPGKVFSLELSIEQMEALADSIDKLKKKRDEKQKKIDKLQPKLISYLTDAGIKVTSSVVIVAQEPAVMERTTELSAAAMKTISEYADALVDIQPDTSFLIAQFTRWNNVVNQTNGALKQLSDANNQFLAAIQPTLT